MKTLQKCEICGEKNFKFLFKQKDKNFNIPGEYSFYKCNNCKIIFLNPQPIGKELSRHYPENNYYSFNDIIKKEQSRKERFKLYLYDLYFNPKNKNVFAKIIFYPFFRHIRGTKILPGKRILDIGCGAGQFLYEMEELGMISHGIEPEQYNDERAKKLNIRKNFRDANYPSDFFDVVTMNQVLHHMNNPSETLTEINRILKKNGTFILCLSNYRSIAHKIFGKEWYQFDTPRHLFNYSDKVLIKFLKEKGFKIKKVKFNSRPDQFVQSFYYKKGKPRKGFIYKSLKIIFWPVAEIVNLLKIGDQVEIWCTK